MSNLSNYERETIINYNNEENTATVYTYHKALQNKLNKLVGTNPNISIVRQDDEYVTYQVPKKWIKVQPPRQVNLTDEQRAELAARLAAMREKKAEV